MHFFTDTRVQIRTAPITLQGCVQTLFILSGITHAMR